MPSLRMLIAMAMAVSCQRQEAASGSTQRKPMPKPSDLVKLSLVSGTDRAVPGEEIELAARFEMADGWHIYWIYPGDSGLPTEAAFSAPEGYEVGEVSYPGPIAFESPGKIVTYGYADETALFTRVRVPDEAGDGPVEFSVAASWLACRENCVRGKGTAQVSVPIGSARPDDAVKRDASLQRHRALLPKPWPADGIQPKWTYGDGEMRLELTVTGATRLALFPMGKTADILTKQVFDDSGGQATLRARFTVGKDEQPELRGVLRVQAAEKVAYYTLNIPWPG